MFARAIEWDWRGSNPAATVQPFRETKRERFLLPEELPRFYEALAAEENETIRDYIAMSLFTGGRRSNVEAMSWEQIDRKQGVWKIPAAAAKGGEALTIPLLPQALEILDRRRKAAKSEWVFPGAGRSGHLVEPRRCWQRIVKAAGLHDLRIHDLRRTLGAWQAMTGASLLVIGKSLGHRSPAATLIYARMDLTPVRASMQRAAQAMDLAGSADKPRLLK